MRLDWFRNGNRRALQRMGYENYFVPEALIPDYGSVIKNIQLHYITFTPIANSSVLELQFPEPI
jgi:hypothetical protein